MAINDVYRVTLAELFAPTDQVCLNVFYYEQITTAPVEGATPLLNNFDPFVVDPILLIQNDQVSVLSILVENIVPSADNASISFVAGTRPGQRAGDCLPVFNAWAYRLNRQTTASRNGAKRFVGVSEADQDDGTANPALSIALSNVSTAMQAILGGPPPGVATYAPVIFRAGKAGKTIPEKIIPAVVQAHFPVASASFVRISTQNTRKD